MHAAASNRFTHVSQVLCVLTYHRSRRTNGATQTFRRPSLATSISNPAHQREGSAASNTGVYIPPHAARNGAVAEDRYSKDQLLSLFREQKEANVFAVSLEDLYMGGWEPQATNGTPLMPWSKKDDHTRDSQPGADICWDHDGAVLPLGLMDMTEEEKEVCWVKVCYATMADVLSSSSLLRPSIQHSNPLNNRRIEMEHRKTASRCARHQSLRHKTALEDSVWPHQPRRDPPDDGASPATQTSSLVILENQIPQGFRETRVTPLPRRQPCSADEQTFVKGVPHQAPRRRTRRRSQSPTFPGSLGWAV